MKTILITGGSRGIGEAAVRAAADKFNVAFTYFKNKNRAHSLENELKAYGIKAFFCDVSDPESVKECVRAVTARFSRIDVLVNNAGVADDKLLTDLTDDDWKRIMSVNLDGAFYMTREILPGMIAKKEGAIINVASMWGETGASMESCYSASKAGLIGLTKALAKELAPSNITVNAVSPGAIDTDMMKVYSPDETAALCEEIPLGRLGAPDEVAEAILFLARAKYVTGQILGVNGGYLI